MAFNPPNTFVCPNCGKEAAGQVFDEAWVYYYRLHAAEMLESVAVCAILGDVEALAFLERYFDFYANHYAGFAIHGQGNGKVMPQVLDECVWCILMLRAYYPCRQLFAAEKKQYWYENLFRPVAELVNAPEIQTSVHNHVLWHKSAAGSGLGLAIAKAVTASLNQQAQGLGREVCVKPGRFNQHVADACVLVEAGNNLNTLDQVLSAMPYLADAIAEWLRE